MRDARSNGHVGQRARRGRPPLPAPRQPKAVEERTFETVFNASGVEAHVFTLVKSGEPSLRSTDFEREPVVALRSDHGELKIIPYPEGTRGYDDLRRAAERQPIGRGLRPSVASPGDLARMLSALGREQDIPNLIMMRRLIELEHGLHRGIEL